MSEAKPNAVRVLALDDVDLNLEILREVCAQQNWALDTAQTATAALELARNFRYTLMLFDIQLPDFNGDELLQRLRAKSRESGTADKSRESGTADASPALSCNSPAFAITGDLSPQVRDALLQLGFAQVFAKPYALTALRSAMAAVLAPALDEAAKAASKAPEVQPVTHADAELFDERSALAAVGNSAALMLKLRHLFGKELSERWSEIQNADSLETRRAALHKLSGSAGLVGAQALTSVINTYRADFSADRLNALGQCILRYQEALSA